MPIPEKAFVADKIQSDQIASQTPESYSFANPAAWNKILDRTMLKRQKQSNSLSQYTFIKNITIFFVFNYDFFYFFVTNY